MGSAVNSQGVASFISVGVQFPYTCLRSPMASVTEQPGPSSAPLERLTLLDRLETLRYGIRRQLATVGHFSDI